MFYFTFNMNMLWYLSEPDKGARGKERRGECQEVVTRSGSLTCKPKQRPNQRVMLVVSRGMA